jgi:hypothetical protein
MKRLIGLLAGALVAAGSTVATVPPARGEATVGDDWTISVTVPRTSWSKLLLPDFTTSPCNDLPFTVEVGGSAVTTSTDWSLSVDLRPHGATDATVGFPVEGVGPGSFPVTDLHICGDFKAPDAHPDGLYDVTGEAHVPSSTTPTRSFSTSFTVDPLWTNVAMMRYDNLSGASVISCTVTEVQSNPESGTFYRPVTGGSVVLEQLVAGEWTKVADGAPIGNGSYSASAGTILPVGTYVRFVYSGSYSVAGALGMAYQLPEPIVPIVTPPLTPVPPPAPVVVVQPKPTVKLKAVSARSRIRVDVNPNKGRKYWTFQVQRKNADGSWTALKTYRTQGTKETRTVNLRKGTYRVWVNAKFGYQGVMSPNEVTLKR